MKRKIVLIFVAICMEAGYLSTEDFWNGEGQNAISLQGYETAK